MTTARPVHPSPLSLTCKVDTSSLRILSEMLGMQ